jgi:hypothetical protein
MIPVEQVVTYDVTTWLARLFSSLSNPILGGKKWYFFEGCFIINLMLRDYSQI